MAKLKLNPESLRVESFASVPATPHRGTVAAHSWVSDVVNACSEPATHACTETEFRGNSCDFLECFATGAACG